MPVKKKTASKKTSAAGKTLVIVESPHKAETIQKFLGSKYMVTATIGHLRDLPKSRMGVKIEENFEPDYINVRGKADKIRELKTLAKDAKAIYLATDPDREGEAISWHLCSLLELDPSKASRIEFNEITKPAILKAVSEPRPIDMKLVDAQQGRRVIDRLVGYEISPLLWQKVGRGLSAGRVQSAALKLVCDREREIKAFVPREYWLITAKLARQDSRSRTGFPARLEKYKNKKIDIPDKAACDAVLDALKTGKYTVASIKEKVEQKKPYAPYTTSTLMQDASYRLGFGPERTRRVAQQLYESGYITYIRTDSVRISSEADAACKAFISAQYSAAYLGSNTFSNRNKGTQDAHEAIRPSDVNLVPEKAAAKMDAEQEKLYRLIWSRFVASRMKPALYDTQTVDIKNGDYSFRANSRTLKFDGFLAVYSENDAEEKALPALNEGEDLKEIKVDCEQKFTEPPSRYTEASLIKELEDKGIGRPSTYAAIVSNLEDRKYVKKEKKAIAPTSLGMKVTEDVMEVYFKEIVDTGFTASMESDLDNVEEGSAEWKSVVGAYYNSYVKDQVREAQDKLVKMEKEVVLTDEKCPQCGKPLALKQGRFGEFLACTGFPDCSYSRSIIKSTGVSCPKCGGDIIVKRSRKGKLFYGCSNYPKCDQVFWYMPVNKKCPKCGSLLVKRGRSLVCSSEDCRYREKTEEQSEE
ncbi:MAG: type I DNA topoisomerase [Firmicutes bacterium]|nr:type I DNA topoisomerase [Bacillota bacterium]